MSIFTLQTYETQHININRFYSFSIKKFFFIAVYQLDIQFIEQYYASL